MCQTLLSHKTKHHFSATNQILPKHFSCCLPFHSHSLAKSHLSSWIPFKAHLYFEVICLILSMEWYYESNEDELVTTEQQVLDSGQLSDKWNQWGICSNTSFDSPNKYFVTDTKSSGEIHFSHNKFSDEVEMDLFSHERDQSSMFADGQSYLQNEESRQNHGNYMHEWNTTKAVDLSEHSTIDIDCIKAEIWNFSLSSEKKNKHITTSHHPLISEEKISASTRAHIENVSAPTENDAFTECGNDKVSVEESLLQDFEFVMNQMSEKTRYCFRDALYRLAKNSENPSNNQNECDDDDVSIPWQQKTSTDEYARYNKSREESEAKTNTIDRTVASLMFSNMNFSLEGHQQT